MSKQVLSFQWDINHFDDSDLLYKEFFESHRFSTTDPTFKSEWKLRLYPNLNISAWDKSKNLSLKLLRFDSGPVFDIKCSISFLNRNGRRIGNVSHSNSIRTCFLSTISRDIHQGSTLESSNYSEKCIDNGTLSILCEIEMSQKGNELMTEKQRVHMRGTSCLIKNIHKPVEVEITKQSRRDTIFYLPYGSIQLKLQTSNRSWPKSFIYLIDENRPEILICRVSVRRADEESDNVTLISPTRSGRRISYSLKTDERKATFLITPRCFIECMPDAYSYEPVTAFVREMQANFRNKFLQPQFGDISINVDGKTLRAHKDLMGYHSPVFAAMFNDNSNQDSSILTVQHFPFDTILAMIEFIYIGDGNDEYEKPANPSKLLKAAEKYQLYNLKKKCEEWLCNPAQMYDIVETPDPLLSGKRATARMNFLQPNFGDISIDVDGQTLRAHKDILSCHSPVFATMFSEAWCGEGTRIVKFNEFYFETILAMVDYIYFGGSVPEGTDLADLLKAADMYQLELLKSKCELWLCKGLNKNNVVSRLALSNTYDLSHLKNAALCFPEGTHPQYYN